jgi:hypothetical protein
MGGPIRVTNEMPAQAGCGFSGDSATTLFSAPTFKPFTDTSLSVGTTSYPIALRVF